MGTGDSTGAQLVLDQRAGVCFPAAWQPHPRPGWGQQIPSPILASWLLFGTCQWEALEEIKGQEGEKGFPRAACCGQGPDKSTVHSEAAAASFPWRGWEVASLLGTES